MHWLYFCLLLWGYGREYTLEIIYMTRQCLRGQLVIYNIIRDKLQELYSKEPQSKQMIQIYLMNTQIRNTNIYAHTNACLCRESITRTVDSVVRDVSYWTNDANNVSVK